MSNVGELSVIVGGMFSGKSTELQRQGRRKNLAGKNVLYVKPKIDTRYTENAISTHDGQHVAALVCENPFEIFIEIRKLLASALEIEVVLIDEVQFFDKTVIGVIDGLLRTGIDVVCSGLDLDRFGEPFGVVPTLAMKAEKLVKLNAVCSECGEDSWVSAGKFKSDSQVEVGKKDKYQPLCRKCYYEKGAVL